MDESKETILIAGGAGFIGSHLCKKLLNKGKKVICVDNFITGDKNNIRNLLKDPKFTLIRHDVSKPIPDAALNLKGQGLEYIFHLASPASPNKKSPKSYINYPIETLLVNSIGTYNLLKTANKFGSKFLYASSSEIYGDPAMSPQKEDYFGNVNPNGIRSVYDEGKRFGEAMTFGFIRKYGLNARVVRIFNTFGPMMQVDDGRVVSNFINQAIGNNPITVYGDGSQTRSLCYVDDMVDAISLAMFSDNTKGEVFNLGNPDERAILDLANLIRKMTSSSSEIVFERLPQDDPGTRNPDIKKAEKILDWKPGIAVEEGLRRTIKYFRSISQR